MKNEVAVCKPFEVIRKTYFETLVSYWVCIVLKDGVEVGAGFGEGFYEAKKQAEELAKFVWKKRKEKEKKE